MTEQDVWDEGSELSELRELHRQDRMPSDVRERLLRFAQTPSGAAHGVGLAGVDAVDASLEQQARPSWPAPQAAHRRPLPGARFRRTAYALGASALVAAGVALAVGGTSLRFGGEPEHVSADGITRDTITLDSEAPRGFRHESSGKAKPSSGDPNQAELRVVGWLIPNSLARVSSAAPDPPEPCRYGFQLSPLTTASNAVLRVEYGQCKLPDALVNSGGCVKITADGYVADDGHVEASRVLAEAVHCQP
jgi:hypothetical protein